MNTSVNNVNDRTTSNAVLKADNIVLLNMAIENASFLKAYQILETVVSHTAHNDALGKNARDLCDSLITNNLKPATRSIQLLDLASSKTQPDRNYDDALHEFLKGIVIDKKLPEAMKKEAALNLKQS